MRIDTSKPLDELIGANRGIVRQILGRIHCCTAPLAAARQVWPKGMRGKPKAIRRGLAKCILDTLREYRTMYFDVMTGNL